MRLFFVFSLFILSLFVGTSLLASFGSSPAFAQTHKKVLSDEPDPIDSGVVVKILKPDMILLDNNNKYNLENIRVPVYYSDDAVKALQDLLLNKRVFIYNYSSTSSKADDTDRYGVPLVQVVTEDDHIWVQDYLVSNGLSWAFTSLSSRKMIPALKKLEYEARIAKKGFWNDARYKVKNVQEVLKDVNSYQIVEGTITDVTLTKNAAYLNFGPDWKTDFSIRFPREYWSEFRRILTKFDTKRLKDKKIKIRGWVEDSNGPLIELTHFEQMDVLNPDDYWQLISTIDETTK